MSGNTNTDEAMPEVITSYKGFDRNWQCRGYQFAIGETHTHDGEVRACNSGFHACEYPLDVFKYYEPSSANFAIVEQSGKLSRHAEDSKVASSSLTVKASIDLPGIIKAAIEYTFNRAKPVDPNSPASNSGYRGAASNSGDSGAASNSGYSGAASNSGYSGAASNSGYRGAASNSGYSGAASNSGYRGAASNSGDSGAASNSGDRGAASNSGYRGAASNSGDRGAASNSGKAGIAADFNGSGRAKSCESGAIVCTKRDNEGNILNIRASKVGENGIKPDIFYTLNAAGEFEEVAE
jgi:hypothetical protein